MKAKCFSLGPFFLLFVVAFIADMAFKLELFESR